MIARRIGDFFIIFILKAKCLKIWNIGHPFHAYGCSDNRRVAGGRLLHKNVKATNLHQQPIEVEMNRAFKFAFTFVQHYSSFELNDSNPFSIIIAVKIKGEQQRLCIMEGHKNWQNINSATLEDVNIVEIRRIWWVSCGVYGRFKFHWISMRGSFLISGGYQSFLSRVAEAGFHLEFLLHNCHTCHTVTVSEDAPKTINTLHLNVQK